MFVRLPSRGLAKTLLFLCAVAPFLGLAPIRAREIRGSVASSNGTPIPDAAVTVPRLALADRTDDLGMFTLSGVPPGRHVVVVRAVGFRPDTQVVSSTKADVRFLLAPDPIILPPVIVTGRRVGEAERTTAFVTSFHPAEVAGPTTTVPELLDEAVGVRVRSMGGYGSFSTLSIRSSTSEQVRVYLDGVPLNQALGGGVNLATIPLSTVERVEVYRGVIPPQFGGSGIAGVVSFTTRAPSDTVRWNWGLSYGTWDTRMAHGWASRRAGPVRAILSVDYSRSDNDFSYWDDNGTPGNGTDDGWARRRNNQFFSLSILSRISSLPHSPVRWTLSYSFLHTNDHLPGNSTFREIPSTARLMTDQHLVQGMVGGSLPLMSEGEVRLFRSFRREQFDNREGLVGLTRNDTDDGTRVWGGQLSLATLSLAANRLAIHANFQGERYQPNDRLVTDEKARAKLFPTSRRTQIGLYLSDEAAMFGRRIVLTGQVGHERALDDLLQETPLFGPNRTDTSTVTAWPLAVGLLVTPRPWIRFRANRGRYLRLPNLYELFGNRGASIGNGLLRPETGINRDIGVEIGGNPRRWGVSRATAELVYFHNTVTDMITYWTVYNYAKPFNIGGADIRGVEASGSLTTNFGLTLAANFSWQRPINRSVLYDSLYYGNDLPNRPRAELDLRAEYAWRRVNLFYDVNAHNRFFTQPLNSLSEIAPAAWLHHAGLRVRLTRRLTITLEGKNLTDVREFHSTYVPLPGRSWFLSVQGTSL